MTDRYVHPWYQWVNDGKSPHEEYRVVFYTSSDRIVDSRHNSLEDAEIRRRHCDNLLHKLNVSEDTIVKVETGT